MSQLALALTRVPGKAAASLNRNTEAGRNVSPRLKGNLAAFVAMLFWATGFPVVARILETWEPLLLAPFRLAASAIVLLLILVATGGWRRLTARDVWTITWIGGGILSASTVLLMYGQSLAHPITVAVIISMMPMISASLGMASGTERMTWALAAGIVLSVVGGAITSLAGSEAGYGDLASAGSHEALMGAGLVLGAVTLFVVYTRSTETHLSHLPDAAKAGLTMFAAMIVLGDLAFLAAGWDLVPLTMDFSTSTVVLILWLGIVAIGFSMALWFVSVSLIGTTVTSMHHNLVPFYVILISLGSGGIIATHHWIGAALVIAGAVVAQLAPQAISKTEMATLEITPRDMAHRFAPHPPRQHAVAPHPAIGAVPPAPVSRRRDVETGMIIMACAMLYLPLIDTFAKLVSGGIEAGQVSWSRFFFQTLFLAPFALHRYASWQSGNQLIHMARGGLIATATLLFFAALKYLPLADAISIFFIEPLILTVLSAIVLGEKIGWRRSVAVVIGFVGALIVIRPSYDVFGVAALLPMGTALTFAIYLLLTRGVAQREDPITIQFMAGIYGLGFMTVALLAGSHFAIPVITPVWPTQWEWLMLLGVGVVATSGHVMVVHAFKRAEAGILAPFQYLEIIPSVILGLLIFGDFPDALTWCGISIIIGSGVYVFHRERAVARAQTVLDAAPPAQPPQPYMRRAAHPAE